MYFTVRVHEPLKVHGESFVVIKKAFQPTTPSSQDWGTSEVLPFPQGLGVPEQAMGGSPKFYR